MYAKTPPANIDLSRFRLRHIATWIRDDLDPEVAREGPDVLRPDDVVILHGTFVALRHATNMTSSDLRATGIYKAIMDISGVATRWPGRLCDECDKIILIWAAKFGPLSNLHPFLYGRGGRLEGIASVTEYSKEALLKRWQKTCPEKIQHKRSHRLGNLGFRAGAWWINSLFAYHAGIIGLESVEGGTTFDKHGAYALVLKDTGRVEAYSADSFTYRVPQNDKGKYRLTAATRKSRDPIRVLRSHRNNNGWGPKAGIRYEGLYAVKGWSICQAKEADLFVGEWSRGDIIFEIRFERQDPVPTDEVNRRPTAVEVDDYLEYKRLRRVYRESKRSGPTADSVKMGVHWITKAAPPISPSLPQLRKVTTPKALVESSPISNFRKTTFKHPRFSIPEENPAESADVISPMTTKDLELNPFTWDSNNKLEVPTQTQYTHDPSSDDPYPLADADSTDSSNRSNTSNIRDVAPWIDFDIELSAPSLLNSPRIVLEHIDSRASVTSVKKADVKSAEPSGRDTPSPVSALYNRKRGRDAAKGTPPTLTKSDSRKSVFVRSRNPMAKLFDGANGGVGDGFEDAAGPITPPIPCHESSDYSTHVHSPIPLRPFSPDNPFAAQKRNAIPFETNIEQFDSASPSHVKRLFPFPSQRSSDDMISPLSLSASQEHPFVGRLVSPSPRSLPFSLGQFISHPRAALPVSSPTSTCVLERLRELDGEDSGAAARLRRMVRGEVVFKDSFASLPGIGGEGSDSEGVMLDFAV
ncbi:hypothetical protein P153DRAFT_411088 [Dothidotthia symphoricarpi CBS 119687]|uniref:YDG domain-containing protein n=1 Tax=Dothidotthia symphoricarpi CBS 119687 TaxID=1392245 RepID=A0A6A5ZYB8_9PLEO|nr:uncharacterized protein P153DRAFT_411088 [Dothidotthia symphoricarpi CBS 119687]KAF2124742.1 hypothetical protein P153DRAFT_411088 [Dothidotthia symphoricarpi CBS 119687]